MESYNKPYSQSKGYSSRGKGWYEKAIYVPEAKRKVAPRHREVALKGVPSSRSSSMPSTSSPYSQQLINRGKNTKKYHIKKTTSKHNLNVATLPVSDARSYTEQSFENYGKNLDTEIPDFDKNYLQMQRYCKNYAKDIPRRDMPVIDPNDMPEFDKKLEGGWIDIFRPYAFDHPSFPRSFKSKKAREGWVLLGQQDGHPTDDVIEAEIQRVPAKDLKPLQSEIYLNTLTTNINKFGKPQLGSPVVNTTIIASKDGYILDGHHRWGQVMLTNPDLKMKVLKVPLDTDTLIKVGRSYGAAIGNKPRT